MSKARRQKLIDDAMASLALNDNVPMEARPDIRRAIELVVQEVERESRHRAFRMVQRLASEINDAEFFDQ